VSRTRYWLLVAAGAGIGIVIMLVMVISGRMG
jgi:hypothetical protein